MPLPLPPPVKPRIRFCKDCEYFSSEKLECRRPQLRNLVTGEIAPKSCSKERERDFYDDYEDEKCGHTGLYYKPAVEKPEEKESEKKAPWWLKPLALSIKPGVVLIIIFVAWYFGFR